MVIRVTYDSSKRWVPYPTPNYWITAKGGVAFSINSYDIKSMAYVDEYVQVIDGQVSRYALMLMFMFMFNDLIQNICMIKMMYQRISLCLLAHMIQVVK